MDKKRRTFNPPLAGWLGGKSRLAQDVIERIPEHVCYVEPFAGAAWVLFKKPPSKAEVLNDINGDIVNVYRVIKSHPDELARQFEHGIVSRAEYRRLQEIPAGTLTDIQRAARFLYLLKLSFGGHISKPTFGYSASTAPRVTAAKMIARVSEAFERLQAVVIEQLGYADCIRRYDRPYTFFYLDPPYMGCENDYGKGVFGKEDFPALAELLSGIKGKFLLSLNDRPEIREIFSAFTIEEAETMYSIGNANKRAAELFITNY